MNCVWDSGDSMKQTRRRLLKAIEPDVDVSVGEEIRVEFDRSKLHYFDPATGESLTFSEQASDAADPVAAYAYLRRAYSTAIPVGVAAALTSVFVLLTRK
jgi:hypothetical protein